MLPSASTSSQVTSTSTIPTTTTTEDSSSSTSVDKIIPRIYDVIMAPMKSPLAMRRERLQAMDTDIERFFQEKQPTEISLNKLLCALALKADYESATKAWQKMKVFILSLALSLLLLNSFFLCTQKGTWNIAESLSLY
jgi:hypothetical protein